MSYKVSLHLNPLDCPRSHCWSQQISRGASQEVTGQEGLEMTLAPENTEMEAGKKLRDRTIPDNFGMLNVSPGSYHMLQ